MISGAGRNQPRDLGFHAVTAGVLLACAGCGPAARETAAVLPPAPVVDGTRALALVEGLVRLGPRPTGSPGGQRAAEWIAAQCRELGYTPVIDTWITKTPDGQPLTCRNVRAVLQAARELPGAQPIIIGSHYDTKRLAAYPTFVGANDGGSSTGLLLEIMHTLKAGDAWQGAPVEFMFFDGEECIAEFGPEDGLLGSQHAAAAIQRAGTAKNYRAMILLDMIGDRDLKVTFPPDGDSELTRRALTIAEAQGRSPAFTFMTNGSILDDHSSFQALGIPVIDFIDFSYGPNNAWWHTDQDTMDKLSADSLSTVGNVATALVWELAHGRR